VSYVIQHWRVICYENRFMNLCELSVPEGALKAFRMLDNVIENHCVLIFRFYQKPFKAGLHSDLLFSTLLVQNCCLPWGRRTSLVPGVA